MTNEPSICGNCWLVNQDQQEKHNNAEQHAVKQKSKRLRPGESVFCADKTCTPQEDKYPWGQGNG